MHNQSGFQLSTRTLSKTSKRQAVKYLGEQGIKPGGYRFVFHQSIRRYSVFAGLKQVAVIQEGPDSCTMAILELVDHKIPEKPVKVAVKPAKVPENPVKVARKVAAKFVKIAKPVKVAAKPVKIARKAPESPVKVEVKVAHCPVKVVHAKPPVTDWSKYDQGQIWEIYQGLVDGVDVSRYVNPLIPAIEMCAMRLAV